ncbi:carbamoyltransferase [Paenibacillus sambharensis]|uniref:Carbamoyltransferase n=1 Tax=Paenibacillus sambharensis TaxID=1803190 RepID=A0A2W1LPP3_9BACL|nr:carbamoyltransferase C-terminal domain-containing protein [Paenibacillus sambharensis]PZD96825.1 carbamoyltransferase [Paenibacillus sambharensis]
MNILGLGGSTHDFSACVTRGGLLESYIEEERVTRAKHSLHLGVSMRHCRAAGYCLDASGLTIDDMDEIIGSDIIEPAYYSKYAGRITLMNHHLAHAASAYYPSSFEEAAVLVADGRGSQEEGGSRKETFSFYYGRGKELVLLDRIYGEEADSDIANSLGKFYEEATAAIGFGFLEDGKTMGLAPYGTGRYVAAFSQLYELDSLGRFRQTPAQLAHMRSFIAEVCGREGEGDQARRDVAYAVQYHTEQAWIAACRYLHRLTGAENLCLAGGVALNSVANEKLLRFTPFKRIFVQPASGDAGTAIGSALYAHYRHKDNIRTADPRPFSPYLGRTYSTDECTRALAAHATRLNITKPANIYDTAARLLSEGSIIGWFSGRSEIGPRALGNRSILADPRQADMKDILNRRVKHREPFRPFAPIVLEERQEEYFALRHPSYYMLLVPEIIPSRQSDIPSVTHYDGTGRVQTVNSSLNPQLYQLVKAFDALTGTPVLLNTSFNDNGEPIVESPEDAVACFLRIDLDYLVIGDYLVQKSRQIGLSEGR